jgi:hypothetical protein
MQTLLLTSFMLLSFAGLSQRVNFEGLFVYPDSVFYQKGDTLQIEFIYSDKFDFARISKGIKIIPNRYFAYKDNELIEIDSEKVYSHKIIQK